MYADHTEYGLKLTCLINVPGHSSDKCRVLGDFGTKYAKNGPTKYHSEEPTNKKDFGIHHENNDIVQHELDENILQERKN